MPLVFHETFEVSQTTDAHQYIVLNLREGVAWEGVASSKACKYHHVGFLNGLVHMTHVQFHTDIYLLTLLYMIYLTTCQ